MKDRIKCLFVMQDHPISPDAPGGGPVTTHNRLELLAHSNVDIDLVILSNPLRTHGFSDYVVEQPEVWKTVQSWCTSHRVITLSTAPRKSVPPNHLRHLAKNYARLKRLSTALSDPTSYLFNTVNEQTMAAFNEVVAEVKPDMIWVENLLPAVFAWRSTKDIQIVYGHHDWIYRVLKIDQWQTADQWHSKFRFWLLRRVEETIVRQVGGCVSTSAIEAAQLSDINSKHVAYFPQVYAPIDLSKVKPPLTPPRVVHLGGMGTIANRIGLERFLDVTWPALCRSLDTPPELWVIGSMKGVPESLATKLQQAGAICTGFVQDLGSVLRPYDIHIIPWEHNTGCRTRIPLAFNYAQVIVSIKAAAACLPELKDGEDCVLVNDLQYMSQAIVKLLFDEPNRRRLGAAGRMTFMKYYTREAIQPRFRQFINELRFDSAIR